MNKYLIATDACSDLTPEIIKKHGIEVIPMVFEINGKTYHHYFDARELNHKEFYKKLRNKEVSRTSLVNVGEFIQFFTNLLENGQDILYIAFSSGLSGTYQSAVMAIEMLKEDYPNQKIIAVDTLAASLGLGALILQAALQKEKGASMEEVAKFVEDNKQKMSHLFTVEELGTLKRGGRLSGTAAFFGSLLGVKPILHITEEGKLEVAQKSIGRKKSLIDMVNIIKGKIQNPEEQTIFIAHGDCLEEAKEVGGLINATLKVKDIVYSQIGPMIGSHSGPGTIAVFFMSDRR